MIFALLDSPKAHGIHPSIHPPPIIHLYFCLHSLPINIPWSPHIYWTLYDPGHTVMKKRVFLFSRSSWCNEKSIKNIYIDLKSKVYCYLEGGSIWKILALKIIVYTVLYSVSNNGNCAKGGYRSWPLSHYFFKVAGLW